ncbi:MAG: hypothetical protein AAF699_16690 [Pseudomonadota bacterium]
MEITVLQVVGSILMLFGVYCFYKNEIEWNIEIRPGKSSRSGVRIDFTPDKYKYKKKGVLRGKWVRPFCALVALLGFIFIFVYTGETVAISI